jgi:flagellar hook-associated protein 3 FlgL
MITNLSPSNEAFLASVDRVQRQLAEANAQVSSGKRVSVASDAPNDIGTILQLHTDEVRNSQIQANLVVAQADANASDAALGSAIQLMDRATVLAAQGANFTLDATGRKSIAGEVQSLLEQMAAISNTMVQGRYIFGGDQDSTPPNQLDLTAVNGVTSLTNAPATRRVESAAGGSFAVSQSARSIFDSRNPDGTVASNNVFASLNNLRLGLLANDTTKIGAAGASLKLASDQLNISQAFYGSVENRISDATNYSANYDVQLKTELSQKEDADLTAAALAITQGNTQLQASFLMQAKMPRTTLFDFMA